MALGDMSRLPVSLKVLLENLLRFEDGKTVTQADIRAFAEWIKDKGKAEVEIAYRPARVLMQDFTGVPAVVDLAAMRDAAAKLGADPKAINPLVPVDLVIDHSVMVDYFGKASSLRPEREARIRAQHGALRVPEMGPDGVRQFPRRAARHRHLPPGEPRIPRPDGVDEGRGRRNRRLPRHLRGHRLRTTMINGLSVLGWGVGGIEAEAAMLGQPVSMLIPEVIGFKLTGKLPEGATATDLVLTVTQMLRKKGVVGKFVEFYGPGIDNLSLEDQATIANMAPEYGATCGFFPISKETINFLSSTGRLAERVALVEAYAKAQGFWRADMKDPVFTDTLDLELSKVEPSIAGPKRPQDRIVLRDAADNFAIALDKEFNRLDKSHVRAKVEGEQYSIGHGDVVIAAITELHQHLEPQRSRSPPACWRATPASARSPPSRG